MTKNSKYYWILAAGLIGGLAEVIWITLYSFSVNAQLSSIGTAVAATIYAPSANYALAPFLGLAIHMTLSVFLAFGFALLAWPLIEKYFQFKAAALVASVATLTAVWKINFFLVLPLWNPEFVNLMPMSVTLISKVLFGLSMGIVFTIYQKQAFSLQDK